MDRLDLRVAIERLDQRPVALDTFRRARIVDDVQRFETGRVGIFRYGVQQAFQGIRPVAGDDGDDRRIIGCVCFNAATRLAQVNPNC